MEPRTEYARSGDCGIAYQVLGEGSFDLVYVPGFVSNVELAWRIPDLAAYLGAIASFSRLILFDKRGTGMSDRIAGVPSLETRMDDVRAVMDAAGSSRAALMGTSEGGALSVLFAVTHPDRISALVLFATSPRPLWAPDYPFGEREEDYDRWTQDTVSRWGSEEWVNQMVDDLSPGYDEASRRATVDYYRQSASPGAVLALEMMNKQIDVRALLPAIRVPTLVLSLTGDTPTIVEGSRYMAERIPGARLVEIPGRGHVPTRENMDPLLDEIKRFLAEARDGDWAEADENRIVTTLLFTDIVDSSSRALELGDRHWRELLAAHHQRVRAALRRYRGRELDTAGDGFFACFDGPARAIRCAHEIIETVHDLGLDVRAGLHTGECEIVDGKVAGIAVHTAARVAARAEGGEVLVSSTLRDIVAGSGIRFDDRGTQELKGIGRWQLYALEQ